MLEDRHGVRTSRSVDYLGGLGPEVDEAHLWRDSGGGDGGGARGRRAKPSSSTEKEIKAELATEWDVAAQRRRWLPDEGAPPISVDSELVGGCGRLAPGGVLTFRRFALGGWATYHRLHTDDRCCCIVGCGRGSDGTRESMP